MKKTLVLAATLGLLGALSAAQAGQFKNVQTNSLNASACVTVHSSPQNQGNAGSAAMQMENYEFIPPAAGNYKCCIGTNATNRPLTVRLITMSGASPSAATTGINLGGCTTFVSLPFPYAYQCTVSTGPNLPVAANGHYTLQICRQ
jgi:hypothetical protein